MKNKKAFTVVELVIVIVIIAVLAAVLIPTFASIIKKANVSKDEQLIRNLNTALVSDRAENGGNNHRNMTEALEAAEKFGYEVGKINASATDNEILWDQKNDVFCYLNGQKVEYIPNSVEQGKQLTKDNYQLWKIYNAKSDAVPSPDKQTYSIYLGEGAVLSSALEGDVLKVKTGVDVGRRTDITAIEYSFTPEEGKPAHTDAIIRTNSFSTTLTVNAPQDTVKHFDYAASVSVEDIKDNSYDEYGTVGRIKIEKGHIEMMPESEVFCLMEIPSSEGSVKPTTVNDGATIHKESTNLNAANGIDKDDSSGIANGLVDDCGPGRHAFSELIVDSEHVYDVCTCCGYTLVRVIDQNGVEIKQTKNTLVAVQEQIGEQTITRYVVAENGEVVTPVETYQTSESIPTKNEGGNTVVDTDNINGSNLPLDGNGGKPLEDTPVVVSKDEDGKPIAIDRTCKHEFAYSDYLHETDDICLGTCKKCGLQIHTKHDWVVKTQLPGQTEYDSICTKCGCTRETNVAQIVGGEKYATLPEAFAALSDNATATIKLINNEKFDIISSALTIKVGQNITLDLNGHILSGYCDTKATSAMITNEGTLTLKDSTDTNNDGTGKGKMFSGANGAWQYDGYSHDYSGSFASNLITNTGILIIENGYYENLTTASATYVVDNNSTSRDATCTVKGGKLYKTSGDVIRMYCNSETHLDKVSIEGGIIENSSASRVIWIQLPSSSNDKQKALLEISGGYINGDIQSYSFASNGYFTHEQVEEVAVNISGGTFAGSINLYYRVSGDNVLTITGGSFINPPTRLSVRNGEYWTPIEFNESVNNYVYYKAVDESFVELYSGDHVSYILASKMIPNWFMDGEELELHSNITLSSSATLNALKSGETFIFKLNGFNLTTENGAQITVPSGVIVKVDRAVSGLFINASGVSITGIDSGDGFYTYTGN